MLICCICFSNTSKDGGGGWALATGFTAGTGGAVWTTERDGGFIVVTGGAVWITGRDAGSFAATLESPLSAFIIFSFSKSAEFFVGACFS